VDRVWHLHLVYTRSYWATFCGGALGRQIHHQPTAGGELQVLRFREQYVRTCALYEAEFGCAPPAELWPSVSDRFGAAPSLQWVDLRRYWVVPKPTGFCSILWSAAVAPFVLLTGCADRSSGDGSVAGDGSSLWPLLWIAGILAVAGYNSYKTTGRGRDDADEHVERNGWSWHFGDGDGCGGCGGCGG
jgi:hypothetical protein